MTHIISNNQSSQDLFRAASQAEADELRQNGWQFRCLEGQIGVKQFRTSKRDGVWTAYSLAGFYDEAKVLIRVKVDRPSIQEYDRHETDGMDTLSVPSGELGVFNASVRRGEVLCVITPGDRGLAS